MKLYGMAKQSRDKKILDFITSHPIATLREVGDKFGVTPQMVFQIKRANHYN